MQTENNKRIPRGEYPRPQFVRDCWMSLNGEWEFSFEKDSFDRKIIVPYVYQSELSGIGTNEECDVVWYRKNFTLPEAMQGKRILLHFGAVDYLCRVWVNGQLVMLHEGGHIGFEMEITQVLKEGFGDAQRKAVLAKGKRQHFLHTHYRNLAECMAGGSRKRVSGLCTYYAGFRLHESGVTVRNQWSGQGTA